MGLGRRIMLGFASCGMYGVVRGPQPGEVEAQGAVSGALPAGGGQPAGAAQLAGRADKPATGTCSPGEGPAAPCRLGRRVTTILIAGAVMSSVFAVVMMADGHRSVRATTRHLGILFTTRGLQRLGHDPFLVGVVLCVLAVLGFVLVTVAVITPVAVPAVRRILPGGTAWVERHRPRPQRARRRGTVARRPLTMGSTRPDTRPVARKRVLGRTES